MRNQEYLTLKERLEILFGIRGAATERAVRLKELNALADRVTRLREDTASRDSGWRTPTLINGWTNRTDDYGPVRYRRLSSGLVVMQGLAESPTYASVIFVLPEGFRPSSRLIFDTASSGEAPTRLDVNTNGDVYAQEGGPAWVSVACCFHTEED